MSEAARQKTVTEAAPSKITETFTARAYAAASPTAALAPFSVPRRAPGDRRDPRAGSADRGR